MWSWISQELVYIEKKQSDQTLLHLTHLDEQANIASVWTRSKLQKKSSSSAQAQKGVGANHSHYAAVLWTSQMPRSQYSLKSSVQHFCHGSKMPQTAIQILYTPIRPQSCWPQLSKAVSYTYCLPASLSRCHQRYPFAQVLAATESTWTLKCQSQKVWSSRRAPRQPAKKDHSTEAWPQFREVQQHILITAMERGNPGVWFLVLGLLSTVYKQMKCVRTALKQECTFPRYWTLGKFPYQSANFILGRLQD